MLTPAYSTIGGIRNYFQVLEDNFTLPVEYMSRGARNWPYRDSFFQELVRAYKDLLGFKLRIKKGDIDLIQINCSLGLYSVIRDGLFVYFAHKQGIKVIVFFRGWDKSFERRVERSFLRLFKYFFFRADRMIVLASGFREKLLQWGYMKKIDLETTLVDENLLRDVSYEKICYLRMERREKREFTILFLGRVEISKGVYEAADTFNLIARANPQYNVSLIIAGSGKELDNLQLYINKHDIKNVEFLGHVEDEKKKEAYLLSDVYLLPTYTEGMPNSVLEAMAFSLPVITRKVGAIPDIITPNENGFYTNSKDPEVFASFIQKLIDDIHLTNTISENNYRKAIDNYTTSKVISRIENIYRDTLNTTTNSTI